MSDTIAHVIFVIACSLIYGLIMTFITQKGMNFKEKAKAFFSFSVTMGFTYVFVHLLRHFR